MNNAQEARYKKPKMIRAHPARVHIICQQATINDLKHLSATLERNYVQHIVSSKLIEASKYYLCLTIKTSSAPRILCDICENSERVYIGLDYYAIISEHGKTAIRDDAISNLCQK